MGRKHGRQWGELMAAVGEKPMAIDTLMIFALVTYLAVTRRDVQPDERTGTRRSPSTPPARSPLESEV